MTKWYVGADHAGWKLKDALVVQLRALGDSVEDLGTNSDDSVDYPTYGQLVGNRVVSEPGAMGLVVCGSGIGISIAANKVHGVRCALVHDSYTAQLARQHNDANVIAMGARVIGPGVAEEALKIFRATEYLGGRHQKRVALLASIDPGS